MSEYQYYEFLAVDRPLDAQELASVRALSTRAVITTTRFTNSYSWGEFGGDPQVMMERYYDAHLYFANWGTHRIMLRLPVAVLDLAEVEPYLVGDSVCAWTADEYLVLDLTSDSDDAGDEDYEDYGEASLGLISGIRAELAAGDLRSLYLAWLSGVTVWELQDDDEEAYQEAFEPPVPVGLARLTAPQRALAEFLRVDEALLEAAAAPGAAQEHSGTGEFDEDALARWISGLPTEQKDELLLRAAMGRAPLIGSELLHRHRGAAPLRTVAELLDTAAELRGIRGPASVPVGP